MKKIVSSNHMITKVCPIPRLYRDQCSLSDQRGFDFTDSMNNAQKATLTSNGAFSAYKSKPTFDMKRPLSIEELIEYHFGKGVLHEWNRGRL